MSTYDSLAILPNVYYTVDETAQLLRVSQRSVLQLLKSDRATGIKISRQWRILGAALLDLSYHQKETEAELVADWFAASTSSLEEIWNNDEDAIYDVEAGERGIPLQNIFPKIQMGVSYA